MGADGGAGPHAATGNAAIELTTRQRLIEIATRLLDEGGEEAVTFRALGQAAGLSHNAPYKVFSSRSALLSAVAAMSFTELAAATTAVRGADLPPLEKLKILIRELMAFSREHPARYALLFNNPETAAAGGAVKENALATFTEFSAIVADCQAAGDLPDTPSETLASLIFAALQGLLSIERNGALHPEKGLTSVEASVTLLLELLRPRA